MSKWLKGFCGGLEANAVQPHLIGPCYERVWPYGRLFPGEIEDYDSTFSMDRIWYPNLAGLRYYWWAWRLKRVAQVAGRHLGTKVVITYNPSYWHHRAVLALKKKGFRWVNLVLDYSENDLGENWGQYRALCGEADAHVFLSHWGYHNCPIGPKLHLDSGCEQLYKCSPVGSADRAKQVVLYSGKIGGSGGTALMAKAFRAVENPNVEFWVCGKGKCPEMERAASEDRRFKVKGFVSDAELKEMLERADVLVNPRDPSSHVNRLIFPSKLLHYLSYGKPIVSTWTPGLDPEYRNYLCVVDTVTPETFAAKISEALALPEEARTAMRKRIFTYLEHEKTWARQGERFVDFLHEADIL